MAVITFPFQIYHYFKWETPKDRPQPLSFLLSCYFFPYGNSEVVPALRIVIAHRSLCTNPYGSPVGKENVHFTDDFMSRGAGVKDQHYVLGQLAISGVNRFTSQRYCGRPSRWLSLPTQPCEHLATGWRSEKEPKWLWWEIPTVSYTASGCILDRSKTSLAQHCIYLRNL